MQGYVYVLGCIHRGRGLTYVGWTTDIARRLAQHNAGTGARSTRGRVWVLLHSESLSTRSEAMRREWHLKRDRKFRKQLLDGLRKQSEGMPGCTTMPARPPSLRAKRSNPESRSKTGLLRSFRSSQ